MKVSCESDCRYFDKCKRDSVDRKVSSCERFTPLGLIPAELGKVIPKSWWYVPVDSDEAEIMNTLPLVTRRAWANQL